MTLFKRIARDKSLCLNAAKTSPIKGNKIFLAGLVSLLLMGGAASAANLTPKEATKSQYIVFRASDSSASYILAPDGSKTSATEVIYNGSTYILKQYGTDNNNRDLYYWVRKGYDITGLSGGQFTVAHNSSYDRATSDENLMFSYTQSLADGDQSSIYASNKHTGDLTADVYGAASTSTTTRLAMWAGSGYTSAEEITYDAAYDASDSQHNTKYAIKDYTQEVEYDTTTGKYKFKGEANGQGDIEADYVYAIVDNQSGQESGTAKTYVFTTKKNSETITRADIQKNPVYGCGGEIVVTGTDSKGNMYSAWGTKVDASQVSAEEISIEKYVQNYNELSNRIHMNYQQLPKALTATAGSDSTSGTINLLTEGGASLNGITIKSEGGTDGSDTKLTFSTAYKDAENKDVTSSFSLGTGSVVKITPPQSVTGTAINSWDITVNGTKYTITDTDTNDYVTSGVVEKNTSGSYVLKLTRQSGDIVSVDLSNIETSSYKGWKVSTNGETTTATDVDSNDTVDFSSSDKNITITKNEKDGETDIDLKLADDVTINNSLKVGKTVTLDEDGLIIGGKSSDATSVVIQQSYVSMGSQKVHKVQAGTEDTDAVNLGQLKAYASDANTDTHIDTTKTYSVGDDNKVSLDVVDKTGTATGAKVTITDVAKASDLGTVAEIDSDLQNKDDAGNATHTTVVDAINNLNDKVGDLNYSTVEKGDIKDGDSSTTAIGKLSQKLSDVETKAKAHTTISKADNNITLDETTNDDGSKNYAIGLAKNVAVDSVTTGYTSMTTDGIKVGDTTSLTKNAVNVGDSSLTAETLSVNGKTYISGNGINANGNKITNVAAGTISSTSADAVNGSQLYATNRQVVSNSENINNLYNHVGNLYGDVDRLSGRINRVGAGAAALAALHPLDFDPDDKWDFAAGYGNYRGANATAVGAYYRPNEDTMFSVGGAFGGGENLVNVGFSVKLGRGTNNVTTSKFAMAKEIKDLRVTVEELTALVNQLVAENAQIKTQIAKTAPERFEIVNVERDEEVEGLLPIERVRAAGTN